MLAEKYSPYRVWKSCYTEQEEVLISRMFSNVTFRLSSCADAVICSFASHQMAKEVGCVFGFFCRQILHGAFQGENPANYTVGGSGRYTKPLLLISSSKFIISKGTADDKISRKFETLQRKLHVSQKQYLGQNESDKCVTWLKITL